MDARAQPSHTHQRVNCVTFRRSAIPAIDICEDRAPRSAIHPPNTLGDRKTFRCVPDPHHLRHRSGECRQDHARPDQPQPQPPRKRRHWPNRAMPNIAIAINPTSPRTPPAIESSMPSTAWLNTPNADSAPHSIAETPSNLNWKPSGMGIAPGRRSQLRPVVTWLGTLAQKRFDARRPSHRPATPTLPCAKSREIALKMASRSK